MLATCTRTLLTHTHTHICAHTRLRNTLDRAVRVLAFAWVLVQARGMKRDGGGRGGQRANPRGWLGSVCGVGVSAWVPQYSITVSPLFILSLPYVPSRVSPRCASPSPLSLHTAEPVKCGVRDGRGSILRRVEGVFGRAWHAHTPRRADSREQGWI